MSYLEKQLRGMFFLSLVILFFLTEGNCQNRRLVEEGDAVYYADYLHGQSTAFGEIYSMYEMTAAHKTHMLGTILKVTRLDNGRFVMVRVNDRGPFSEGCIIDLSKAAAQQIDLINTGKTRVRIEVVDYSPTNPINPNRPANYPTSREFSFKGENTRGNQSRTGRSGDQIADPNAVRQMPENQPGFAVQIASYRDLSNAQRQIIALQHRGIENLYLWKTRTREGTTLHKLVIGPFELKSNAAAHLQDIKRAYLQDGIVIRLN